jgi:hypothetical protein
VHVENTYRGPIFQQVVKFHPTIHSTLICKSRITEQVNGYSNNNIRYETLEEVQAEYQNFLNDQDTFSIWVIIL